MKKCHHSFVLNVTSLRICPDKAVFGSNFSLMYMENRNEKPLVMSLLSRRRLSLREGLCKTTCMYGSTNAKIACVLLNSDIYV